MREMSELIRGYMFDSLRGRRRGSLLARGSVI